LSYDKWLAENQQSQQKKAQQISTAAQVAAIVGMILMAV
jgi:hypothetical protein